MALVTHQNSKYFSDYILYDWLQAGMSVRVYEAPLQGNFHEIPFEKHLFCNLLSDSAIMSMFQVPFAAKYCM